MIPDSIYWHCFRKLPGFGQARILSVMDCFESGEAAWKAPLSAFTDANLSKDARETLVDGRSSIDPEYEARLLEQENIRVLLGNGPDFPPLLRELDAPFALLYAKGNFSQWHKPCISVVGSRRHTAYGTQATERIAMELTRAGFVVVSGLAYGIDSVAHEATIHSGGTTIAVLGDSLDDASIHPKDHLPLARRIQEQGALLSEYPPVTPARPETFPARNRIVAGISQGTIVIEAAERSGSLITAQLALEANREVFAVPGPIFSPASSGTNRLIKEGAKIVRNIGDILEEIPVVAEPAKTATEGAKETHQGLSEEEEKILSILSHEGLAVDEIIKSSHLGTGAVSGTLTMLELRGLAKDIGGSHYIRL
ncbi:MAG: DNA-processing protein DprA [Candidatus Moranbacteria bacterium]|nr:DNA-processing protein DprA [Candidatus Moranbacteria bacterium]